MLDFILGSLLVTSGLAIMVTVIRYEMQQSKIQRSQKIFF